MLKTKIMTGFLALSLPLALMACDSNDDDDVAGVPAPGEETGTPAADQETPTPLASPTGTGGEDEVTIDLEEQEGSGFTGTVRFEADGDQTRVIIEADDMGDDADTPRPAHIHAGTCDDFEQVPEFPLEDVVDGQSETTIDVELSELLDGEYVVNVHRSDEASDEYIACGEIEE